MKPTALVLPWLLVFSAQILSLFSAPTKLDVLKRDESKTITRTSAIRMKMHPAKRRLEKSLPINTEIREKKLELKKKTTVTVNGKLLPIASLSSSNKNIHVTVQQSPQDKVGQASLQQSPPAVIQEVVPGTLNSQINPQGSQVTQLNSPPLQGQGLPSTLSNLPQAPGTPTSLQGGVLNSPTRLVQEEQQTVGLSPPMTPGLPLSSLPQAPGTSLNSPTSRQGGLLNSPNVIQEQQQIGLSPPRTPVQSQGIETSLSNLPQAPGTFNSPTSLQGGVLNPPSNLGQQQLHSPPLQGQTLSSLPSGTLPGTLPGSLNNQQMTTACGTPLNTLQAGKQQTLVNLGQNSDGQLTYKPLRC